MGQITHRCVHWISPTDDALRRRILHVRWAKVYDWTCGLDEGRVWKGNMTIFCINHRTHNCGILDWLVTEVLTARLICVHIWTLVCEKKLVYWTVDVASREVVCGSRAPFRSRPRRNPQGAWLVWPRALEPPPPEQLSTKLRRPVGPAAAQTLHYQPPTNHCRWTNNAAN